MNQLSIKRLNLPKAAKAYRERIAKAYSGRKLTWSLLNETGSE